ncbi:MAG TPA: 16S rRNA (adenine(1518)-N(6)/adenine(1519)-N(6))-dimethyltransferase RsmA [Candidatus Limnocylindrales bacterium]|nr:16S rRNA (adenine(1518)-N(6)/adenine(1519)-N(6))-dimethyltransferase RsmA [Candidatus Limnocylindrales bacterium]
MVQPLDPTSPREIVSFFTQHSLSPHRKLGQNFLVDANIVRKITSAAEIEQGDAVIEIGPGAGALTLDMARAGANILALEIDRGLVRFLSELLEPWQSVKVVCQDALNVKWLSLINAHFAAGSAVKLVSNLPYNISGPLMYALFRERFPFKSAVLMFQKEVAQRLVAQPGDSNYGGLSVLCSYYTTSKILFEVSNNVFWPRPSVGSAVLRLEPREQMLNFEEEQLFWKLVAGVFQQRRKTILNSISRTFSWPKEQSADFLSQAGIDLAVRPEQLSAEKFATLIGLVYNGYIK